MSKDKRRKQAAELMVRKVRLIIQGLHGTIHMVEMDYRDKGRKRRKLGLPGGQVEDENLRKAAAREGEEETGLRVRVGKLVSRLRQRDRKTGIVTMTWCYLARVVGRGLTKLSKTEKRKHLRPVVVKRAVAMRTLDRARRENRYNSAKRDQRLLSAAA